MRDFKIGDRVEGLYFCFNRYSFRQGMRYTGTLSAVLSSTCYLVRLDEYPELDAEIDTEEGETIRKESKLSLLLTGRA